MKKVVDLRNSGNSSGNPTLSVALGRINPSDSYSIVSGLLVDNHIAAICTARYLEWDSDFFSQESYRVELDVDDNVLQSSGDLCIVVKDVIAKLTEKNAKFIFSRIPVQNMTSIRALELAGFTTFDISCVFAASKSEIQSKKQEANTETLLRRCREDDIWPLMGISANAFKYSRFHEDKRFPEDSVEAMHSIWIRNLCYSEDATVLVAESNGKITGYITYTDTTTDFGDGIEPVLRIGLLAVSPEHQDKGIGKSLVDAVVQIAAREDSGVAVGTQLSNIPASTLYQKMGLTVTESSVALHRWID